jgi:murein DD-endopeptidase MepM/ murein hydrolase activator NlpD
LKTAPAISLISLLIVIGTVIPSSAHASILSAILSVIKLNAASADALPPSGNVQTLAIAEPAMNIDPTGGRGGGGISIVGDSALMPNEGPSGTIADIERPKNGTISTYVVQSGDTIASVAAMFDVSQGTILAANNLKKGAALRVGQNLVILPITGVPYTVQKGDTLASIAKRYGGDVNEIVAYNGIESDSVSIGAKIIIPNGEVPATATVKTTTTAKSSSSASRSSNGLFANNPAEPAHNVGAPGSASEVAYYASPLSHYVRTQGIHGYNAVDLAAPKGTAIMAAAAGTVTVAQGNGAWNGGYGNYVVISHSNGSQTLYGHMSKVSVYDGETVAQGEVIGYVGSTGDSTGPHLHFEIRNGIQNPF